MDFIIVAKGSDDPDYRLLKEQELEEKGSEVLWNELNTVDPRRLQRFRSIILDA